MAVLWAEGFDDFTNARLTGEYDITSLLDITTTAPGRFGVGRACNSDSNRLIYKNLTSAPTEIYFTIARAYSTGTGVLLDFNSLDASGATITQVRLTVLSDGSIRAYRGASTTTLGTTAPGLVSNGTWGSVQGRIVISDTVGVVQLRLNGSSTNVLNLTGIDTNNGGIPAAITQIVVQGVNGTLTDDIVFWDTTGPVLNTWAGDLTVETTFPNADGDSSQFVGSDGNSINNFDLVNDTPPTSAIYVQGNTTGHKDLYNFTDITRNPAAIYGAFLTVSASKTDSGLRTIQMLTKSGAIEEAVGVPVYPGATLSRFGQLKELDPATGAAWTKTGINSAQFGFRADT